jgi:hypothetical protein
MSTTTAKPVLHTQNIENLVRESTESCEKALKSGIKQQEEAFNLWMGVFPSLGLPEFQATLGAIAADAFPYARKRMDDVIEKLSRAGEQTLTLVEKTANVYQAPSLPEAQRRLQDVTETWLAAVRENVQIAVDNNARIINSWTELLGRFVPATK